MGVLLHDWHHGFLRGNGGRGRHFHAWPVHRLEGFRLSWTRFITSLSLTQPSLRWCLTSLSRLGLTRRTAPSPLKVRASVRPCVGWLRFCGSVGRSVRGRLGRSAARLWVGAWRHGRLGRLPSGLSVGAWRRGRLSFVRSLLGRPLAGRRSVGRRAFVRLVSPVAVAALLTAVWPHALSTPTAPAVRSSPSPGVGSDTFRSTVRPDRPRRELPHGGPPRPGLSLACVAGFAAC